MVKRIEVNNVSDLYPEEMRPPAAGTNGHTPIENDMEDDDIDGSGVAGPLVVEPDQQQEYERIIAQLDQPLDRRLVRQREGFKDKKTGKVKMLDYLGHATVTRAMNRIFGYGRWSQQVTEIKDFVDPNGNGVPRAVRATVSIHVSAPGFNSYEPMAGTGYQAVIGNYWEAYEMALGNALAKAFKKACAQYGDQFGLSLYPEDEETSADAAEETTTETHATDTRVRNQPSGNTQREYADDESAECESCGKEIKGYTNRNTGKSYTTQQLVDMSKKQANGKILCLDCRRN